MIKFYDSGMIPYHSYYRALLYKLFPKQIKYLKKGVKLKGRVWLAGLARRPILFTSAEIVNDKEFVLGNIYEMTREVVDFIQQTTVYPSEYVTVDSQQMLSVRPQVLNTGSLYSTEKHFSSLRQACLNTPFIIKFKVLYEK